MKSRVFNLFGVAACLASALTAQSSPASTDQQLTQISSDGAGAIFGLNANGDIFAWNGVEWKRVAGQLTQVSVGSKKEVWGVNSVNNSVWKLTPDNGWVRQPGMMQQVVVAKGGGAVVALDLNGSPYAWDSSKSNWTAFPNSPVLTQVGIGNPQQIYGIGVNDEIYRWIPKSSAWRQLQGRLHKISIAADGTIGGVNSAKKGYLRSSADVDSELTDPTTPATYVPVQAAIKDVEVVSANTSLFVLDENTLIQQHTAQLAGTDLGLGIYVLDANLVVSTDIPTDSDGLLNISYQVTTPPPLQFAFNGAHPVYDPGCQVCGELSLSKNPTPCYRVPGNCSKGVFRAVPSPPAALPTVEGVSILAQLFPLRPPSSTDYVAQALSDTTDCGPVHLPNYSADVWAEFRLPQGYIGNTIKIPAGAYSSAAVAPCNRVTWNDLTFSCQAGSGWTLTTGNYMTDNQCTESPITSPYVWYGHR